MHLPLVDDRTARARIRDEALRLFAERGPDAVTMRDIAAAAGVSPALLVRHYGSKDGLVEAVDSHVVQALEALLAQVTGQSGTDGLPPTGTPTMLEAFAVHLPPQSPIPDYLSRSLIAGGAMGSALFARLYDISKDALAAMVAAGTADAGDDPAGGAALRHGQSTRFPEAMAAATASGSRTAPRITASRSRPCAFAGSPPSRRTSTAPLRLSG